jgi:hypothetical protein
LKEGWGKLDHAYDLRIRMMASVIACAFVSSVSMAVIALSATLPTPLSESHLVTSSMARSGCAGAMSVRPLWQCGPLNYLTWLSSLSDGAGSLDHLAAGWGLLFQIR